MSLVFECRELVVRIFINLAKCRGLEFDRPVWCLKNTCKRLATIFSAEKQRIAHDCTYIISDCYTSIGHDEIINGKLIVKLGEEVFSSPEIQHVARSDKSYYNYLYRFDGDRPISLKVMYVTADGDEFVTESRWSRRRFLRAPSAPEFVPTLQGLRVVEFCPYFRNPCLTDAQWENLLRLL